MVEDCNYAFPSYDTLVNCFNDFVPFCACLIFYTNQCDFPCRGWALSSAEGFLKTLFIGNMHGFQSYHLHFKDFMLLMSYEI